MLKIKTKLHLQNFDIKLHDTIYTGCNTGCNIERSFLLIQSNKNKFFQMKEKKSNFKEKVLPPKTNSRSLLSRL